MNDDIPPIKFRDTSEYFLQMEKEEKEERAEHFRPIFEKILEDYIIMDYNEDEYDDIKPRQLLLNELIEALKK